MNNHPPDPISDSSEDLADEFARWMLMKLGDWEIPTNPLPDHYFKAGHTMKKTVKKIIRVPIDSPPVATKIIKKVKIVRQVKPEQLSIDGRPSWVPNEPFFCTICKRAVILKPNGECPSCHFMLVCSTTLPF